MKILIGTPTGDGTVTIQYMLSIRSLEQRFQDPKIRIKSNVLFGSASFMPFSRNALASIVLEDPTYSHLLFVDSDMGFAPEAVMKLIDANKDVIGCLYPKRSLNDGYFHAVAQREPDPRRAKSIALEYAAAEMLQKRIVRDAHGVRARHIVENGLIRTLRLGMGLTLIHRRVLVQMAERLPELIVEAKATHYASMGLKGRVLQCFSSISVSGLSLSEDLSFCHRWTESCKGEIWGCVDQFITHIGPTSFSGRLSDRLDYEDADQPTNPVR